MSTPFQKLGGLVYTGSNLRDDTLLDFSLKAHGSWIAPVIYNDDAAGPWNLANIEQLKQRAAACHMACGGWYNGRGGDPEVDAVRIASLAKQHNLPIVVLDLEAEYQGANADLMPILVWKLRSLLSDYWIIVSTNGMNNSMIWNGRTLTPPQSFYDLGIRVAPQWYSAYYDKDGDIRPQAQMKWLKNNGSSDYNFRDNNAKRTRYRGLPLSYVHGTAEATGLEGSDLARECEDFRAAMQYGLTPGMTYYTLERAPDSDMDILAKWAGKLFLA